MLIFEKIFWLTLVQINFLIVSSLILESSSFSLVATAEPKHISCSKLPNLRGAFPQQTSHLLLTARCICLLTKNILSLVKEFPGTFLPSFENETTTHLEIADSSQ